MNSKCVLPKGDFTPEGFNLTEPNATGKIKKIGRRLFYPFLNWVFNIVLKKSYREFDLKPDLWMWGQRGNDYDRHRERVSRHMPIKDKDILIAGCGTGKDIESWIGYVPRHIKGIDWFSYSRAWEMWKERFQEIAPKTEVVFGQGDLTCLDMIKDRSYDIIGSDAVFEHVRNLPGVLNEFYRILRPGGVLYATYGPLWYCWGGDHISGYDDIQNGYNHLILDENNYHRYLDAKGPRTHSEHDGRTWVEHNLFSWLRAKQYSECLENSGFKKEFLSIMISPRAVKCVKEEGIKNRLQKMYPECNEVDFLIESMSIIYRKV